MNVGARQACLAELWQSLCGPFLLAGKETVGAVGWYHPYLPPRNVRGLRATHPCG